ncbi:hypothetical protein ACIO3S_09105 [Nocardioides sp. NPDC087217]|uniref:hypothetical protein n=1 Tax=Nocardioides sp. NPDC087217 TaxID=3364335 RepID=UPI00382BED1F
MRRWVWSAVAAIAAGCGMAALMAWSVPMTLGWWAGGSFITLSLLVCLGPDTGPIRWKAVLVRSLLWPTAALAAAGLVVALGLTSALLVTAAGLAAAWELGWIGWPPRAAPPVKRRRRVGRRRSRAEAAAAAAESAAVAGAIRPHVIDPVEAVLAVTDGLTDSDLCMAWRSSYVALDRATDPSAKLRAVEIRELLLEELGRRDAPGLEAWFRSGARAAGGPDRYLRGATPRPWRGAC